MHPIADLAMLLRSMEPVLNPGVFVFSMLTGAEDLAAGDIVASVREPEGLSVIVPEQAALRVGLVPEFRCAWITLRVNSDLQAVGLTAAFAGALGQAGISCNVVAGTRHDHLFVPVERAQDALRTLQALQSAQSGS